MSLSVECFLYDLMNINHLNKDMLMKRHLYRVALRIVSVGLERVYGCSRQVLLRQVLEKF